MHIQCAAVKKWASLQIGIKNPSLFKCLYLILDLILNNFYDLFFWSYFYNEKN